MGEISAYTIEDVAVAVVSEYVDFIKRHYGSLDEMMNAYEENDDDFDEELFHITQTIIDSDYVYNIEIDYDEELIVELEDCSFGSEEDYDIYDSWTFEYFKDFVLDLIQKELEK